MKKYCIINSDEVDSVAFDKVLEKRTGLRYSVDETKTFVKYEGSQPSFLSGKTEYTHEEIQAILATDEWTSDEEI